MELDELKAAWVSLGTRLDAQVALNRRLLTESRLGKARAALDRVRLGQWVQVVAGAVLVIASQQFWWEHRDTAHLLLAGLGGHVYGLAMIVCSAATIWRISRVDNTEPVLIIQRRLGELERFYMVADLGLALAWWVLWVPFVMAAGVLLLGVDLYRLSPVTVWMNLGAGVIGLFVSGMLFRLSRRGNYPRLAAFVERNVLHRRLLEARAFLEEVERFEREV